MKKGPSRALFEWDRQKAAANLRKHGVSFADAASAFIDQYSITVPDPDHTDNEERFVLIGYTSTNRLIVVAHADRGTQIRIISARPATTAERRVYEEER